MTGVQTCALPISNTALSYCVMQTRGVESDCKITTRKSGRETKEREEEREREREGEGERERERERERGRERERERQRERERVKGRSQEGRASKSLGLCNG